MFSKFWYRPPCLYLGSLTNLHIRLWANRSHRILKKPTRLLCRGRVRLRSKNVPTPKRWITERLSSLSTLFHHPAPHDFSLSNSNLQARPWLLATHNQLSFFSSSFTFFVLPFFFFLRLSLFLFNIQPFLYVIWCFNALSYFIYKLGFWWISLSL